MSSINMPNFQSELQTLSCSETSFSVSKDKDAHSTAYLVVAFYKFVTLTKLSHLQTELKSFLLQHHIFGTILLAEEGINGTVASTEEGIKNLLTFLKSKESFLDIECKFSESPIMPFKKAKVVIKKEIVTLGVPGINPLKRTGKYVAPEAWNALIAREDVLVIDTRNDFEVLMGSFQNAQNPNTQKFSDFPNFVEQHLLSENVCNIGNISHCPEEQKDQEDQEDQESKQDQKHQKDQGEYGDRSKRGKHKKIAMFCTGGIRCEKASAYLLEQGFEEVYQLEGGILKYLEKIPKENSLWQGECFIFDQRRILEKENIKKLGSGVSLGSSLDF